MTQTIAPLDTAFQLEAFTKLDKDLKRAAQTLSPTEARFLVDSYYSIQGYRLRLGNQIRAYSDSGEPHELSHWVFGNMAGLEKDVAKALGVYSLNHPVGKWLRTVCGIGPVLASGFLAHIDIKKAPYAGHIFKYAGYVPGVKWEKGQKRPWNAELKRLCFLAGEAFVKVQNRPRDVYGHIYAERKRQELEANELGLFADAAAQALQQKNYRKETIAYQHYSQGKLPPAHIHARARRFSVKIFLTHLWHVWYEVEFGTEPPKPYVVDHLGHVSLIDPPFWPLSKDAPIEEQVDLTILEATEEEEFAALDSSEIRTDVPPSLAQKIARFKRASQQ